MKILVTGAFGFIGKNLIEKLRNCNYEKILMCGTQTTKEELELYFEQSEFVFHLAGVNRPNDETDFMRGNSEFTSTLIEGFKSKKNHCPILMTSSTQAATQTPYGISKKAGEELLRQYGKQYDTRILIYRLTNVFGRWCRPHYNSVVATFCHNIVRNQPIVVHNPETTLKLCYVDDVTDEFIGAIEGREHITADGLCMVEKIYEVTLGELADKLYTFKFAYDQNKKEPLLRCEFDQALYTTFLSYIPQS